MDDLISRQVALEKMKYYHDDCAETSIYTRLGFETAMEVIKSLPSIDRPTGHWIIHIDYDYPVSGSKQECSECGKTTYSHETNYCPNCGVKMAKSEEV